MPIPDTLGHKIELFRSSGRVAYHGRGLFVEPNWIAILTGQGIWPERYDPLADVLDVEDLRRRLRHMKALIAEAATQMPTHRDFIRQNCEAGERRP